MNVVNLTTVEPFDPCVICSSCFPAHSFTPFVVSFSLKSSLLCSPAVGVDDQTDNWDSRPSNSFSHWSPADQARQPQQAAESPLWLCGTVGTEFTGLVKTHLCMFERAHRDVLSGTVFPDRVQKPPKGVQQLWEAVADSPKEAQKIQERPGCLQHLSSLTGI